MSTARTVRAAILLLSPPSRTWPGEGICPAHSLAYRSAVEALPRSCGRCSTHRCCSVPAGPGDRCTVSRGALVRPSPGKEDKATEREVVTQAARPSTTTHTSWNAGERAGARNQLTPPHRGLPGASISPCWIFTKTPGKHPTVERNSTSIACNLPLFSIIMALRYQLPLPHVI